MPSPGNLGVFDMLCAGSSNRPQISVTADPQIPTRQLCQVYLNQFDPIIKILHRPSLAKHMLEGQRYLDYEPGHSSVQALTFAVCFAAACSLTEEQCRTLLQTPKAPLVERTKQACEAALSHADVLSTQDMTVLQAFVLLLVSVTSGGEFLILAVVPVRLRLTSCVYRLAEGLWTRARRSGHWSHWQSGWPRASPCILIRLRTSTSPFSSGKCESGCG